MLPADNFDKDIQGVHVAPCSEHSGIHSDIFDDVHQPDHLRGDVERVPAGVQEPADVPAVGVTLVRRRRLREAPAVTSRQRWRILNHGPPPALQAARIGTLNSKTVALTSRLQNVHG